MTEPIVLLVGGRSTEHDASVHSYAGLLPALLAEDDERFTLEAVYHLGRSGGVVRHARPPWPVNYDELASGDRLSLLDLMADLVERGAFVLSLLHGNEGEDGAWQGVAEILDLQGNFGSVFASALSMSKWAQAHVAAAVCDVCLPDTWILRFGDGPERLAEIVHSLCGRPCVVKPNKMGASLLTTAHDETTPTALADDAATIFPYDDEVLVQERIFGREMTVGVLRHPEGSRALPVIEAITRDGFLSHDEKHRAAGAAALLLEEDTALIARLKDASVRIFDAVGFTTMCRLDFMVTDDDRLFFLEANALPGLMAGSVYPTMLAAAGYTLADVVALSIEEVRGRTPRRKVLPYVIERHVAGSSCS
jgi:D-alanine-D-alanine ligase